jgi:hypothetical protein
VEARAPSGECPRTMTGQWRPPSGARSPYQRSCHSQAVRYARCRGGHHREHAPAGSCIGAASRPVASRRARAAHSAVGSGSASTMTVCQLRMPARLPKDGNRWFSRLRPTSRTGPHPSGTRWWPPSSTSQVAASCRAPAWWRAWPEGCPVGSRWCVPQPASARRPCWASGPGAAAGRSPGCRWTKPTTTRPGSGAMWPRPWIRCDPGSARRWRRCSGVQSSRRWRPWRRP